MEINIPKPAKKSIIQVLKKGQRYINRKDSKKLKHLSDHTIDNASIYQDPDSLTVAVLIYAISKLLERWGFDSEYSEQVRNMLGSAQESLEHDKLEEYKEKMKRISDFTATLDKKYRLYVERVLDKAQIKKGSRLYEHGISAARAADLLGIGRWELMSYIGKTRIHDEDGKVSHVERRLNLARSLFGQG